MDQRGSRMALRGPGSCNADARSLLEVQTSNTNLVQFIDEAGTSTERARTPPQLNIN